jgi:hypothetical protein
VTYSRQRVQRAGRRDDTVRPSSSWESFLSSLEPLSLGVVSASRTFNLTVFPKLVREPRARPSLSQSCQRPDRGTCCACSGRQSLNEWTEGCSNKHDGEMRWHGARNVGNACRRSGSPPAVHKARPELTDTGSMT